MHPDRRRCGPPGSPRRAAASGSTARGGAPPAPATPPPAWRRRRPARPAPRHVSAATATWRPCQSQYSVAIPYACASSSSASSNSATATSCRTAGGSWASVGRRAGALAGGSREEEPAVQTFTPYADFEKSLRSLDLKRLGKQRVEVIQIVRAHIVPGYAWAKDPAVLMWRGTQEALGQQYGDVGEPRTRGIADRAQNDDHRRPARGGITRSGARQLAAAAALPPWLADEARGEATAHRAAQGASALWTAVPAGHILGSGLRVAGPLASGRGAGARQQENARRRARRATERHLQDLERGRRRHSAAAKRGWTYPHREGPGTEARPSLDVETARNRRGPTAGAGRREGITDPDTLRLGKHAQQGERDEPDRPGGRAGGPPAGLRRGARAQLRVRRAGAVRRVRGQARRRRHDVARRGR